MIAHTLNMCAPCILCTFNNILGLLNLDIHVYTTFGVLTLFICVQSAIQTDSISLYKTLHNDCSPIEDWTDDAGPEQSLVFFSLVNNVSVISNRVTEMVTQKKGHYS